MSQTFKATVIKKLREARHPCNWLNQKGRADADASFRLEWFPIMAGSVLGLIAGYPIYDSGNGTLLTRMENDVRLFAHINYLTGWVDIAEPMLGAEYDLRYCYCQELLPPVFEMRVMTVPIVARPRRLTQVWTALIQ